MVASVRETISAEENKIELQKIEPQSSASKTTSADSRYSDDPDLLIREYFIFASPKQRVQLRKAIASDLKSSQSIFRTLKFGQKPDLLDAYSAAIDLLAEIDNITPLTEAVRALAEADKLLEKSNKFLKQPLQAPQFTALDGYWEILIKGIACAYKISVEERFKLIQSLVTSSNRRLVKSTVIDAFLTIAEDTDVEPIKEALNRFISNDESDPYIRSYAEEALQDLA
jgi:hypothetical protein